MSEAHEHTCGPGLGPTAARINSHRIEIHVPILLADAILRAVNAAQAPLATHDLLDRLTGAIDATEVEVMECLLDLVIQGRIATRSDHGTVYYVAAAP